MNRLPVIFYAIALALHAMVLFWLKPPAHKPPKTINETYVDVALTTPPPPQTIVRPKPLPPPPPKPVVIPPEPKPIMTIPLPKPLPPPPKPVVVPPPPPKPVQTTQRNLVMQVTHDYPMEAERRHQQGTVQLIVYINEDGIADKVEIIKSSGYPLLDEDAIRKVKRKSWGAVYELGIPVRSSGIVTVPYLLQ